MVSEEDFMKTTLTKNVKGLIWFFNTMVEIMQDLVLSNTSWGWQTEQVVYPLLLGILYCTSLRSRAAYSASIPSASGAREKTICDSRHRANSLWCCFSAQSHGVSRLSFSANRSASLCTRNWASENKRKIWLWRTHYMQGQH